MARYYLIKAPRVIGRHLLSSRYGPRGQAAGSRTKRALIVLTGETRISLTKCRQAGRPQSVLPSEILPPALRATEDFRPQHYLKQHPEWTGRAANLLTVTMAPERSGNGPLIPEGVGVLVPVIGTEARNVERQHRFLLSFAGLDWPLHKSSL